MRITGGERRSALCAGNRCCTAAAGAAAAEVAAAEAAAGQEKNRDPETRCSFPGVATSSAADARSVSPQQLQPELVGAGGLCRGGWSSLLSAAARYAGVRLARDSRRHGRSKWSTGRLLQRHHNLRHHNQCHTQCQLQQDRGALWGWWWREKTTTARRKRRRRGKTRRGIVAPALGVGVVVLKDRAMDGVAKTPEAREAREVREAREAREAVGVRRVAWFLGDDNGSLEPLTLTITQNMIPWR